MKATGVLNSATLTTATRDKVERSIVVVKITAALEDGSADALGKMLKQPITFEIRALQATMEIPDRPREPGAKEKKG
jgi:hypothetical protein